MDLFDYTPPKVVTNRDRWLAFHEANPQVYTKLVQKARAMLRAGWKQYAINNLFGVLRYERDLETQDEPFKLNNNFRPYYARLIMLRCPDLDGFFEVRVQRAEQKEARDGSTDEDEGWRDDPFWRDLAGPADEPEPMSHADYLTQADYDFERREGYER